MNIKELIKQSHELYVKQGKYKCPECEGAGKYIEEEYQDGIYCDFKQFDCEDCDGTGINLNKNISELLMNIITDLCDALKCWVKYESRSNINKYFDCIKDSNKRHKKDMYKKYIQFTFEDHIAGVFIGLFDICKTEEIKIFSNLDHSEIYNFFRFCTDNLLDKKYETVISMFFTFCNHHNINIESHIKAKLEYMESVR